jgi:hypothetical protein
MKPCVPEILKFLPLPEKRKAQRGKFTLNLTELESKTTRSLHQINLVADM